MKIGLDFDGVFCSAEKLVQKSAKKLFDLNLEKDSLFDDSFLDQEKIQALKQLAFGQHSYCMGMDPVSGVFEGCKILERKGYKLQIITKRNKGVSSAKRFCFDLGLDIPIIGIEPHQSKSDVVKNIDIFLDDSINNLKDLKRVVPHTFLFSWAYNLGCDLGNSKRVYSWKHFTSLV